MSQHRPQIHSRSRPPRTLVLSAALTVSISASGTTQMPTDEAACTSLTPAAVGGPLAADSVITFQWLGTTNYELAHGNTIVLLDAYYDRGAPQQVNSCSSRQYGRTFKWGRES
jgi:hypothetical protein